MSEKMFGPEKAKIAMLGLDAAGKTTILYKLKINENVTTIPTVGFNVEEITFHNLTMTVWDVGGQKIIRYYDTKYESFPCIVYYRLHGHFEKNQVSSVYSANPKTDFSDISDVLFYTFFTCPRSQFLPFDALE